MGELRGVNPGDWGIAIPQILGRGVVEVAGSTGREILLGLYLIMYS